MLLPANPYALDLSGAGLGLFEGGLDRGRGGPAPIFRVLFFGPGWQTADERIATLGTTEHLAVFTVNNQ